MFVWNSGDLNKDQADAILCDENVFLVACPGSGKTRTLTYKIAVEISKLESNKQFVIAITYTNRAADEIRDRVESLGIDTKQLWIGTIHAFCLEWILRPYHIYHEKLARGFSLINSHESEVLLTRLCKRYTHPKITYWDCGYYFKKNGYELTCQDPGKHDNLNKVLQEYFTILEENKQLDFELILYFSYELILKAPAISHLLSKLFSIVLVDEYQDTKEIQYAIVASIIKSGNGSTKSFIVGDPNQSIFQTLGGFPMKIKEFEKLCGIKMKRLFLSKNYRSSERIIEYFSNFNVYETKIQAASEEKYFQSWITLNSKITKENLDNELVRLVEANLEAGIKPSEICIVAPWWIHLSSITRRLTERMPDQEFDGPGTVPFSRDIENFWYKLSKIILTEASPKLYIRRLRWAGEIIKHLDEVGLRTTHLSNKSLLRECNSLSIKENDGLFYLKEAFQQLAERLNVDFMAVDPLKEQYQAFFESSKARVDRMRKEGIQRIGDIKSFKRVFKDRCGITISTIHGVKGAEFDTVIAFGLLKDIVPHFNDPNPKESAFKLLYVISSRARKNLHLISETGRVNGIGRTYSATTELSQCKFDYDDI